MTRRMSARQLLNWMAYAELEPFDERRADWRAAQIVTMLANVNRDSKKRPKPYTLEDFVLKFYDGSEAKKPKQTVAQQKGLLMAMAQAFAKPVKKS